MGFQVTFWGVRGTIPCAYSTHMKYGGNTSCLEVRVGDALFILDAGTGLRALGKRLRQEGATRATLLLTHTHHDHVSGFPFFEPAYCPDFELRVVSGPLRGSNCIHGALSKCMETPLFPVPMSTMGAGLRFRNVEPGTVLWDLVPDVVVRTAPLNHPGGAIGYRIEHGGHALCYVTDTEHEPDRPDENILRLIDGADLVIYDATYTDAEYAVRRGWGHSTWSEGVRLCRAAGARSLALFHHDPDHDDAMMDTIEAEARLVWAGAFAAREGMTVDLLAGR